MLPQPWCKTKDKASIRTAAPIFAIGLTKFLCNQAKCDRYVKPFILLQSIRLNNAGYQNEVLIFSEKTCNVKLFWLYVLVYNGVSITVCVSRMTPR